MYFLVSFGLQYEHFLFPYLHNIIAMFVAQESLGEKFGVSGIPALIVLDSQTGEVVQRDGRAKVAADSKGEQFPWAN